MGTWADLALREIGILALLTALGAGPSAFLAGTQAGSRIALAPGIGLALGAAVLVSAGDVISLGTAAFAVLLPMIVASLTVFGVIQQRRRGAGQLEIRAAPAVKLGLLVLFVASALSYPLAHRESLGPVAYRISDANGYVALTDRFESHSFSDRSEGAPWDITAEYGNQQSASTVWPIGVSLFTASANSLFDWHASDAQSAWMIVLVIIISLGSFAAVQEITSARTWAAVVAGLLMAGPFTYQLFVDGSQGALSLMCLIPPLAVLGSRIIRQPRAADLVLTGLLIAAGPALYQAGAPALALWAAAVLAMIAVAASLRGRLSRDAALRAAKIVAVIAVLGIALAPIAFARSIDFDRHYLAHQFDNAGIPYKLPIGVLPSWLLQSRGLYDINGDPTVASSLFKFLLTALAPAVFVGVAIFGILRYRTASVIALVVPVAVLLAALGYLNSDATYPVDRNLLIAAVAGAILLSVGLAALAATGRTALRVTAVLTAALALVLAGRNSYVMASRVLESGQIVPGSVRDSLSHLRGRDGTLYLEGLAAASPNSSLQMPATYHLVNEATPNRLAVDLTNNDFYGPAYLGGARENRPATFDPAYRWILTVIPSIATNRETVARVGNVAIQRRTQPLDVTVGSGIATDPPSRDPDGNAWVESQLKFFLTGAATGPAWVRLTLEGRPVRVVGPPGSRVVEREGDSTTICAPARGAGPMRESLVSLGFEPAPRPTDAPSAYALPHANHSLRLAGMWGVRRCPGAPSA